MTHDEIQDLLGAYALDAVDADERALLDEHVADCARCRAEVAEHREVATLLAHTGGDAPDALWQRIAGSLDDSPPDLRLAPVPPAGAPPSRRVRWPVAPLAAAAAIAVAAILGVQVRRQDARIDDLQSAMTDPMVSAFDSAITDPDSELLELTSTEGDVVLRGAVTEDGTGYLSAKALPDLSSDRTYQLWGVAGEDIVSLGVLGEAPELVSFPAERYEAFAITEEDAPGVVASQNDPVAAGSTA